MDGDIVLNISTTSQDVRPRKKKVVGNRRERIRARKAEKFHSERGQSPSDSRDDEKQNVEGDPEPRPFNEPRGEASQRARTAVISSLFNCNPKIPTVPRPSLTPMKEEVFSTKSFHELNLHPFLVSNLESQMGVKQMTSVQSRSIPVLLAGRDALVKSQTGSGKTLAYAIPVIQSLQSLTPRVRREDGPYAIVLVPTRELAIQSHTTFQKLVRPFVWVVPGCIMGGEKRKAEKSRLRKGINVLVATPGRLLDHLEHTHCLDVSGVRWLILDEADRLLDMGYEKDVAKIVTALNQKQRSDRQTVMLSATLTAGVERLAGITLKSPERISVTEEEDDTAKKSLLTAKGAPVTCAQSTLSSKENTRKSPHAESFTVPDKLKQHYVIVPCKLRLVTLAAFILSKCKYASPKSKMIVFLSTQDSVSFHHSLLDSVVNHGTPEITDSGLDSDQEETSGREDDVRIFKLHGDMQQKERTQVYQEFSVTSSGVLLCTDVAARGLDLPKVRWIVQYTSPLGAAEYVHRVGRTARAGGQGQSLLFLMPAEVEYIKTLHSHQISLTEMTVSEILKTALLHVRDIQMNHTRPREVPRTYEEAATLLQIAMEERLNADRLLFQLAQKAYQSFIKAYSTYPADLKAIFCVRNLHLGHVAKSFALRETPKDIGLNFSKLVASSKHRKRKPNKITFVDDSEQPKKKQPRKDFSEYASGSKGKKQSFSGPGVGKRKRRKKKI